MWVLIEYILKNKEWLFSGIGVAVVLGAIGFFRRILKPSKSGESPRIAHSPRPHKVDHWSGIVPPDTKYETVWEEVSAFPIGPISYSFEYGPRGHVYPLRLAGRPTRVEIQFTCQIGRAHV